MRYYRLLQEGDETKSKDDAVISISEESLSFNRYIVNTGIELSKNPIEVFYLKKEKEIVTDYAGNDLAFFIVTEKFKVLLETFNIGETQFIPVKIKDKDGTVWLTAFLVKIRNEMDALDLKNSVYEKEFYFEKFC